jgi:hypothetical protein
MRGSATLVADVTTLNMNLMFEIGVAIGLGMPVITIRDTTLAADQRHFKDIGLLDTLGFLSFTNSDDLASAIGAAPFPEPLPEISHRDFRTQPIYLLQSPIRTDGSIALTAAFKKARTQFRAYDSVETPRLSLHEARRQVAGSRGVVADMISPRRGDKAMVHNARSALVCGMAFSQEKAVLMLMEDMDGASQPIDYRDVAKTYNSPANVPALTRDFVTDVVARMQVDDDSENGEQERLLTRIDLGDLAAENEIRGLRHYFVETGQAVRARQGHARLVTGRKGAGKTAIFYDVRSAVTRGHDRLVIDLKPEGHQFLQLKEAVLDRLGTGLREHTMVAFWQYILLSEIARYALHRDRRIAGLGPQRYERYERLREVYGRHDPGEELDFSQRLLLQVDRVSRRLGALEVDQVGPSLTEVLYSGQSRELREAVVEYMREKEAVWLLVDNLDKGWPIRGASDADILVVRALLEATRKVQRALGDLETEFSCLVFLRSDIHEMVLAATPDKGKDSVIALDWEDPEVFEQILMRRLATVSDLPTDFVGAWGRLCAPLVDGESSFGFIVDRTLMRPRNLLRFIRHAIDVAVNRGNDRVSEDDLVQAERLYSQDVLSEASSEITDTHPELDSILFVFEGAPWRLDKADVLDRLLQSERLRTGGTDAAELAADLLLWFGVIGVQPHGQSEAKYAYEVRGDIGRLRLSLENGDGMVVINPAFRSALLCREPD